MRVIAIALLVILALAAGGCSVVFLFASLLDPRPFESLSFVAVPALIGLAVAAVCVLGIRAIRRSGSRPEVPPQPGDRPKGRW